MISEVKRLLFCSLLDRAMTVYVGLDVMITTDLELNEVGESGCMVVYDCPEGNSGISSMSSRPGRDGSGTPLGMGEEVRDVVPDDDFTEIEVGG